IYASKHVSTALARVTAVNSSGAPTSYDFDSMIFVDEDVAPLARNVGGWAAGVPDEAEFDRRKAANLPVTTISPDMGDMTYQTHVVDIFGSEPAPGADLSGSYNGKQDANGNRARMQDWQYEYELEFTGETKTALGSYTASAGPDIAVGDWAVINVFNRGTGQTTSGPPGILAPDMMFNRQYVTNYLSASGINALLDYWNKNILDTEMINLLKANGNSSIFDDSLEIRATQGSSFWTNEIESELSGQAYSWQDQFPFVVAFGANSFATSANTGVPSRIIQDYNLLLGNLYNVGHCQVIEEWAQGFGYSFRSQCFTMNGVDIPLAATHCIPEGDNGCKGDGLRQLSSVVNMFDKPVLSMEAVTVSGGNLKITWADAITEVAQNYSNGVNRVILHGAPYSKSFNGYFGGWPGWQAFGTAYGDAYTYKQPYWEDADTMTGYFARNQAVLQKGLAKVDLLVLRDQSSVFSNGNGNTFQTLLDRGYSYNMTSEGVIKLDGVSVSNGVICENGPAYKALILSNVTNISAPAMQKILGMAQAGLPVILYGASVPTTVYGTDSAGNNTAAMLNLYSQLTALDNVYSTADQDALLDTLTGINIVPAASYNIAKLQASRYIDKTTGTNYYYMFNDVRNGASGMLNNNSSPSATWKGGAATAGTVTLTGNGVPCLLDAWTGAIEPVTVYTDNGNGTVSFDISLSGGESKMYAVLPLTEAPPSVKSVSGGAEIIGAESGLALRAGAPGTYDVTRRDGAKLPVTVTSVPSSIDLNSGWSLRLESWGPDDSADNKQAPIEGIPYNPIYLTYDRSAFDSSGKTGYDGIWKEPSATIKSDISFSNIQLMKWADLPASPQQLQNIGVSSMANVSGIGYYTNKFILSSDWENAGAILNMSYGRDSVTKLTVNGHVFDNVNNVTDKMDIGDYLISGAENTIEIKIASTLFNRARLTNMADMRATGAQANLTDNGLTSVTLTPYAQVSLVYSIDAIARTGGTVTGGGEYSIGSSVTLKAAPNSNYRFDGWYEGAVKVSSSAYYTFRVNSDRALQASFTYVAPGSTPIIEYFNNPDMSSKPMARMWFPDAEAGVDDNDLIEKQIFELADKGFGGVEVAMLADGVNYSNAEGKEYGWGTENWSKLLKKVLKAAAKVPGGFQVDMTITAHWPPALNTIDPNDDAANKELSYSFTKIIDSDLTLNDYIELNLPPTKTSIAAGGFGGGGAAAGFVFTDTFVSAAIAQV
ncbi:MAG: hypothetical protein FWH55_14100, partial [Oscillospiraceae bacterium]|nr:hypothetical protein [Oscillospiraceae bacterium]